MAKNLHYTSGDKHQDAVSRLEFSGLGYSVIRGPLMPLGFLHMLLYNGLHHGPPTLHSPHVFNHGLMGTGLFLPRLFGYVQKA